MTQHERFLKRLAEHSKLSHDHDLRIFLTYKDELEVRAENTQEKVFGFFKSISRSADEVSLLSLKYGSKITKYINYLQLLSFEEIN